MSRPPIHCLVLLLVAGVPTWCAAQEIPKEDQRTRATAETIRQWGGRIELAIAGKKPVVIRRNAKLPEESFQITRIDLGGKTQIGDEDLLSLGPLPELVELNLNYTRTTDKGLDGLKAMPKLKRLYLAETNITDQALLSLNPLKGLESLTLSGTEITDKNLGELAKLEKLKNLFLARTKISPKAVETLHKLSRLEVLHLTGIALDENHLADLKSLTGLKELSLTTNDPALAKLSQFEALRVLFLNGPRITDAGLARLEECQDLKEIRLSQTSISRGGLNGLQAKLQDCRIMAHPISKQSAFLLSDGGLNQPVLRWPLGDPQNAWLGLVPRPAELPGFTRWQLESVEPRSEVRSVDFSPDGNLIACATAAGHIRIYAAADLTLKSLIPAHPGGAFAVAWHPQGQELASSGADGRIRVWDRLGKELRVLRGHRSNVLTIAWSPDGTKMISGSWDGDLRLWNGKESESLPIPGHEAAVMALAWSADGKSFASGSRDKTVRVWNLDGEPQHVLKGHTDAVISLAWSDRGSRLASGSWDKTIRFWNPRTGRGGPVLEGHTYRVYGLEWHPQGSMLASAGDRTLRLWALDGTPVKTVHSAKEHILTLSWKHDGNEIALGTRQDSVLRVVDVNSGTDRALGERTGASVMDLSWHPSGDRIAAGCMDRKTRLITTEGRVAAILGGHNYRVRTLAWSPKGDRLATGGDAVLKLWNAQGVPLASEKKHEKGILGLAWSPDGSSLATVGEEGDLRIWDRDAKELAVAKLTKRAKCVAWSPDNQKLATASETEVQLWNREAMTGQALPGDPRSLTSLAWNHVADQIAVGGWTRAYQVWDGEGEPGTGGKQNQAILDISFDASGSQVAFALFGNKVAIAQADGSQPNVWEAHAGPVNAVAWHPDGKTIASAGYDNTIRFWEAATAKPKTGVFLLGDDEVAFSGAGQLEHGDPAALENELIYIIETEAGERKLLSPSEFEKEITGRK